MKLKKSVRRKLILFLVIVLFAVGIYIYLNCFDEKKKIKSKITNEIKEYGYVVKDTQNDRYKEEFKNLQKVLSNKKKDEEAYVKSISKLFIIDFYSLEDKLAKTDIGGKEFVHEYEMDDFLEKAQDTIYKYVENNLYGERKQKLPSVDKVEVTKVSQVEYSYKDKKDEKAYQVEVSWTYKKDTGEGYQTKATLFFVHEDKKLYLVELK
ncbi:MAG: hypothetical protein ILA19_03170 [Bacilli bacterium]|nr:hypothetical protein [Bacilli bacterium]